MDAQGHQRSLLTIVVVINPAIWPSNRVKAESQVLNLHPATGSPRLQVSRTPNGHEGRKHAGHAMPVKGHISPAVSPVFHIHVIPVLGS